MRNLIILLFGRFTSMIGNAILGLALPLLILEKTSSPSAMGNFISITMVPTLFLLPLIGVFVEKINKKWIMVISDILQFSIFTLLWYISSKTYFSMVILTVIMTLSKIVGEVFDVTSSSIFPRILSKELFVKGNSLKGILDNIARIITPIFGVFLYKSYGIGFIFLFNGITFLVSAISEVFIIYENKIEKVEKVEKVVEENIKEKKKGALQLLGIHHYGDVIKFIRKDRILTNFMIFVALANFIIAPFGATLFPFLVLKRVGFSEYQFGMSNTIYVIGMILASSLFLFKKREMNMRKLIILDGFVFLSIGISGAIAARIDIMPLFFYIYSFLYFSMGSIGSLVNIPIITAFQKLIPEDMQGRFFAFLSFVGGLLVPLGIFIFSNLSSFIPTEFVIILNSLLLLFTISRLDFDIHKKREIEEV